MRKLMLILLVAVMTAPAMAAVTIEVASNGDINYACTDTDADGIYALMAGVAIIITVDAGDTITVVDPAIDGESTAADPGYGVFMKTAQIGGDPLDWVTGTNPEATPDSPGEVGGIGENQITLEFGALYDADTDAPLAEGTLCTITIGDGSTSLATLALEDVARGGIVMEGGAAPSSVVLIDGPIGAPCMMDTHPDYAAWELAGKPDCWCYEYQCKGDADGLPQFGRPVMSDDLAILAAAYGQVLVSGDPGHCADFDHLLQFGRQVMSDDLAILAGSYGSDVLTPCDGTYINDWIVPVP